VRFNIRNDRPREVRRARCFITCRVVQGLAVAAGGEALALGSVHAGDAEEAALWRFEAD
jgi:hypothetical protein